VEPKSNVLEVLLERGFVKDSSDLERLRKQLEQPTVVYYGCDATAVSFHVGSQVGMMTLAWLQRFGHTPIALMGGGTTMVGDPSERSAERPIMTPEEIAANADRLQPQFARFIDFDSGALMLDNSDWLLRLNLIEFLRDVGSKFSINHMLAHETYKARLEAGGLSFLEFSYQLLQAYDYLHLYRDQQCVLQVGGSDQWANILAGVDLIRRSEGAEAFALVWPLITTASGAKMGKTAQGAVWLNRDLLSPFDYYQFWINVEDADVERFLALFTFLAMDEVKRLSALPGAEIRQAKEVLAFEVTTIVHGRQDAEAARRASRALFAHTGPLDTAPSVRCARSILDVGVSIVDLVSAVGLIPSKREARRKIAEGAVSVNEQRVGSVDRIVTAADLSDNSLLLRCGKKRYLRVVVD